LLACASFGSGVVIVFDTFGLYVSLLLTFSLLVVGFAANKHFPKIKIEFNIVYRYEFTTFELSIGESKALFGSLEWRGRKRKALNG